ncbi:rhomboid family intramembrane serine protease [Idiomarina xiamenensis]|uniref:Membrane serine peptidase n=1 Tax=Idiomarina xiamenensis 10-D-4 TaxID=740709 RepID=K2K1A1_9GAMM|nr:rhomboid family intramembrane serine protease [Idiomarina xiamenensis]EKE81508.1 membrane serine peptidase [Idiomarina xiamenensis 10-D-4]
MKKLLASRDQAWVNQVYQVLHQRGIPINVSERGEQLEIWVIESSYYALAKATLDEYKADPSRFQSTIDNANSRSQSPSLVHNLLRQAGWFTIAYAAVAVLIYLLMQTPMADDVIRYLRISDYFDHVEWSQPWRLLTPALLHFSATHIVFNVFWWWYLGGRLERYIGSQWLIAVFVFSAICSNIMQFYVGGPFFGGLSGVVYGLLGFFWIYSFGRRTPLWLPPAVIGFLLIWLVIGYTDLLWVNVANTAHLAGLISGCIAGAIVRILNPKPRQTAL